MELSLEYGASLGGVVLLQLLKYDDIAFNHLFFEGTSFYTNAKLMEGILRMVFLHKHKKAVADPELSMKKMSSMFEEEEIMFLPVFIIPLIAILIRKKKSLMLQTLR